MINKVLMNLNSEVPAPRTGNKSQDSRKRIVAFSDVFFSVDIHKSIYVSHCCMVPAVLFYKKDMPELCPDWVFKPYLVNRWRLFPKSGLQV